MRIKLFQIITFIWLSVSVCDAGHWKRSLDIHHRDPPLHDGSNITEAARWKQLSHIIHRGPPLHEGFNITEAGHVGRLSKRLIPQWAKDSAELSAFFLDPKTEREIDAITVWHLPAGIHPPSPLVPANDPEMNKFYLSCLQEFQVEMLKSEGDKHNADVEIKKRSWMWSCEHPCYVNTALCSGTYDIKWAKYFDSGFKSGHEKAAEEMEAEMIRLGKADLGQKIQWAMLEMAGLDRKGCGGCF